MCFDINNLFDRRFFLLQPFTKVLDLETIKKKLLEKSNESKVISEYAFLTQKGDRMPTRKNADFRVFASHLTVHS